MHVYVPPRWWSSLTGQKQVCLHHVSLGGHHIRTPCYRTIVVCCPLTPLPLCVCLRYWLPLLLLLLSPAQTRGGSRVAPHRHDWVGYIPALDARPIWLARHWQEPSHESPVIDMRPHSQRLASPGGEGLAICHCAERENGIRSEWRTHKRTGFKTFYWENRVNLI